MTVKVDTAPRTKGLNFVRAAIAAANGSDHAGAVEYAKARWGATSAPVSVLKSAVSGMSSDDWLGAEGTSAAVEFFAAVFERSIAGRLLGLRRVPLRARCLAMASGTSAFWVQQGNPIPVSRGALDLEALAPLKVAAITVTSKEAIEATDNLAEIALRNDLVRAVTEAIDAAFIDPSNAGAVDVRPASVTSGATTAGDIDAAFDAFAGDLAAAYAVLHPKTAVKLSGADNPALGARGGEFKGVPVVTSRQAPAGSLTLIDPTALAYGGDGGEVRASRDGTVEMSDAPGGAAEQVSLFQAGAVALGCSAHVNWRMMRADHVVMAPVQSEAA
jgi:hypothetical protein